MFENCIKLSDITPISNWDIQNVTNMKNIFKGCNKDLKIPSKFNKNI